MVFYLVCNFEGPLSPSREPIENPSHQREDADAGYQGIEKREEMQGRGIGFRIAMRPGKRRVLPQTPEGLLDDLIETAKAHIRAKGEHPFRVMKQQSAFRRPG